MVYAILKDNQKISKENMQSIYTYLPILGVILSALFSWGISTYIANKNNTQNIKRMLNDMLIPLMIDVDLFLKSKKEYCLNYINTQKEIQKIENDIADNRATKYELERNYDSRDIMSYFKGDEFIKFLNLKHSIKAYFPQGESCVKDILSKIEKYDEILDESLEFKGELSPLYQHVQLIEAELKKLQNIILN